MMCSRSGAIESALLFLLCTRQLIRRSRPPNPHTFTTFILSDFLVFRTYLHFGAIASRYNLSIIDGLEMESARRISGHTVIDHAHIRQVLPNAY